MVEDVIPWPMLSDPGGRIGSLYGVYDENAGINVRATFIVDPDGIIQASEVLSPSVGRCIDELIRQLAAFQHSKSTGEVIPACWIPGKKTLKPSAELVGKVHENWEYQRLRHDS